MDVVDDWEEVGDELVDVVAWPEDEVVELVPMVDGAVPDGVVTEVPRVDEPADGELKPEAKK